MERRALGQGHQCPRELGERQRRPRTHPQVAHQTLEDDVPERRRGTVPLGHRRTDASALFVMGATGGDRHHADPQRPAGRLDDHLAAGVGHQAAQLRHALQPAFGGRQVDGVEHLGDRGHRRFDLGALLVMGDLHQDVRLEIGLVPPDAPDDRGIGQLAAGVLGHPLEHPFEGQVARRGLETLLLEDGAPGGQQDLAQLTTALALPGAPRTAARLPVPGGTVPGGTVRALRRVHVHVVILHLRIAVCRIAVCRVRRPPAPGAREPYGRPPGGLQGTGWTSAGT